MAWYKTGDITLTNNSAVVTAASAEFNTYVKPGFGLVINDSEVYEIASVDSNTQLTLAKPYAGTTKTNHENWAIYQTQGIIPDLVAATNALHTDYGAVKAEFNAIKDAPAQALTHLNLAVQASQVAASKASQAAAAELAAQTALEDVTALSSLSATLTPTPGKTPLADSNGKIDRGWVDLDSLRTKVLNALYPDGIYPFVDLRFVGATKISDPNVAFSRASKATYWDAEGVLREAEVDEPRFEYDTITGEALGLLRERSSTNYITYSQPPSMDHITIGPGVTVTFGHSSPDGGNNAIRIQYDGSGQATDFLFRVYGRQKPEGSAKGSAYIWSDSNYNIRIGGNLPAASSNKISTSETKTRHEFTQLSSLSNANVIIYPDELNSPFDIYIWGIQVEMGTKPTSLIHTNGASATRAADLISYSKADNSPLFPSGEFSAVIDYDTEESPETNKMTLSLATQTGEYGIIYASNSFITRKPITDNGPAVGLSKGRNRISLSANSTTKMGCRNGGSPAIKTLSNGIANADLVNKVSFSTGVGAQQYNGHLRSFQLYSRALPDTKLQELSQI